MILQQKAWSPHTSIYWPHEQMTVSSLEQSSKRSLRLRLIRKFSFFCLFSGSCRLISNKDLLVLRWRISPSFFLVNPLVRVLDTKDRTLLAASSLILSRQVLGDDLWRKNSNLSSEAPSWTQVSAMSYAYFRKIRKAGLCDVFQSVKSDVTAVGSFTGSNVHPIQTP